jgi:PAS domain S-box-containing protein
MSKKRRAPKVGTGAPADETAEGAKATGRKNPRQARAHFDAKAGRAEGQQSGDCPQSVIEDRHVDSVADATERKEVELARLAAIVQSSEDAIYAVDLDDVITDWNQGAERLYGYTAQEFIGQPLTMLIPPECREREKGILERLRRGERANHYETLRLRKDGSVVDVSLTVSPIVNVQGQAIGTSRIARDITERKRAEEEIRAAYERESTARAEAEEANRLRDEFLASLSHELRSPLNSILGWASMLMDKRLDEEGTAHALKVIYRNARAQNQLIGDLLDVSRIIMGKLRLDVIVVDLVPIINAAIDVVHPAADAKEIKLISALDPAAGPMSGDADRLQQVVWNLLSNAVKFTPAGGQVLVRLERADADVKLTVSDTGVGIEPEFLPFVFDRFRQSGSDTTRAHGGLGLGLAIVRHLVELHGGTVSAASRGRGQGATFTVTFPQAAGRKGRGRLAVAGEIPQSHAPSPDRLRDLRVLVVEDDPDARDLLEMMLTSHGAEVRACPSADEALRILDEWRPDVLVSDIGMPEEDGYSLMREVRARGPERGGFIPAIALTAFARSEDAKQAYMAGYQAHVVKPVEPVELVMVVASLVGRE